MNRRLLGVERDELAARRGLADRPGDRLSAPIPGS
jgi:hypothetical protein